MAPLVVDPCSYLNPHHSVGHCLHQRLISRLQEDRCPSVAHTFPLPKPGKGEVRKMAWLNPYDDLFLRILVGRVALAVEAAMGPDVFSHRLADGPPGWSVRDARESFELLREHAWALLSEACCNAIAVADLRHYYPSIAPEVLMDALYQTASPRGAVGLIGGFLRELGPLGAPGGLPIGPEASGLLGNVMLLEVDEAISSRARGHARYTDDSWIFLRAESEWPDVLEIYTAAVSDLGLEVNTSKVAVHPKGSEGAQHAIQHGQIAYLTSAAARYRTPQRSTEEIREELDRDEPDWNVIGFHLGSLRYKRSAHGLNVLYECPQVLNELPQLAGQYLWELTNSQKTRNQIDRDWLVEQATARPAAQSVPRRPQANSNSVAWPARFGWAKGTAKAWKSSLSMAVRDTMPRSGLGRPRLGAPPRLIALHEPSKSYAVRLWRLLRSTSLRPDTAPWYASNTHRGDPAGAESFDVVDR